MADAWALDAGNASSGDYATFNEVVIPNNVDFTLELDASFDPTGNWRPIGRISDFSSRVFKPANFNEISLSSDSNLNNIIMSGVNYSERNLYRFERRSNVISLLINGALQSGTVTDSGVFRFTTFFTQNSSSQSRGASTFYECKIFDSTNTLIHNWKNTTGTAATVWEDIAGNNDATLVNFPTDGTQWLLYDDGGGGAGAAADITSTAPAFTDTIASTLTGNRTATIAGQLPAFAESVNATLTGVTNTVQITELIPAFTASIATTLTGNTTASITESLPSFTASINATTFPAGVTAASITELSPAFTSAINATLTRNRDAQIAGISPAFTDIVNASLSVRIESSIVELSPAFSASISATIPSKWIDVIVPDATWTDRTNTPSTWVNIR